MTKKKKDKYSRRAKKDEKVTVPQGIEKKHPDKSIFEEKKIVPVVKPPADLPHDIPESEKAIEQKKDTFEEKSDITSEEPTLQPAIVCPKCATKFLLKDGELAKCPGCAGMLFECSECGAVVEETMRLCPGCGVSFEGIESPLAPREGVIVCPSCSYELSEGNKSYICSTCSGGFCEKCMGHHVPPDPVRVEVKVSYRYRLKDSAFWENGTENLPTTLPEPLCPECYDKQFYSAIERLKVMVQLWRTDQLHQMSLKILSEEYPKTETERKMMLVSSAQAFLKTISRRA